MFSIREWKRRILMYVAYGGNHIIRCSTKALILSRIGGASDQDAATAFDELVRENLLENIDGRFFTINLDKREEIDEFLSADPEDRLDLSQPLRDKLGEYIYKFAAQSKWKYSNQRTYYYYTKVDDISFWIVITKKKAGGSDDKIVLGSFDDVDSRISRIWRATMQAAKREPDGRFVRKWVEDLEPEACGNNRIPSGAAFRLFRELKLIELVQTKGKTEFYRLTGKKPTRANLDQFFQSVA
jgi:hypothetical protein